MSLIHEDVTKMIAEKKQCTFMKTGLQSQYQTVYFCHDCNPTMNETYCEFCAEKCHFDHHLTKAKNLKTYCFCGKKLHQVSQSVIDSITTKCTFWELDEKAKLLTGNNMVLYCEPCKKRFCSFCVYFCHYHHIEKMTKKRSDSKEGRCGCENICHKDDRHLFYVMKNFSMFRLENLFNTHMVNLIFESQTTCTKLFGFYINKIKQFVGDIIAGRFEWDRGIINSHSVFSRSLTCLFHCVKTINLYHISDRRDEILPPRVILEICLDDSFDSKYEVRVIKKNMLFLMFKLQLIPDFHKVINKYSSKDYANINCIQRLNIYNIIRNDEVLKQKYFDESYNFRMLTIKIFEKYANICRIDDHLSMALFATILNVVKFLMQYGVYNIVQIKMIADILEILVKMLKLENISKSNEEHKEMIFKSLPSLLYIMLYTYNDYVFLENLFYENVDFKEFAIGKSNFGMKILSSVFLANIKYILKYLNSKKFTKIIRLTYKTLAMLTSENDNYLKTLFNIDKSELIEFITYYDILTDVNYNNNFPFIYKLSEMISGEIMFVKRFPNIQINNPNVAKQITIVNNAKYNLEEEYIRYFCLRSDIYELTNKIMRGTEVIFKLAENASDKPQINYGIMTDIMSLLNSTHDKNTHENKKEQLVDANQMEKEIQQKNSQNFTQISNPGESEWSMANLQLVINKTGFHYTIVKLLKISYLQPDILSEDNFDKIVNLFDLYAKDSITNTINVLSSSFLKYFFYYLNRFPHLILKMVYNMLRYLKIRNFILSDYSYIYENLKDAFNCRFSKINDAERYIQGFTYNIKCLKLIKQFLPNSLVNDMRNRIKNFLLKLHKNETVMKEYFWINNFKRRLLMKDSEYQNLIHLEEYLEEVDKIKKIPKGEKDKMFVNSPNFQKKQKLKEAKQKQNQIYQKKKNMRGRGTNNDSQSKWLMENDSAINDTLKISINDTNERFQDDPIDNMQQRPEDIVENINHEEIIDNPSFVSDFTIENDTIIKYQRKPGEEDYQNMLDNENDEMNQIKENQKRNRRNIMRNKLSKEGYKEDVINNMIEAEEDEIDENKEYLMLENVMPIKSKSDLNPTKLPSINDNNFDTSDIKIEDDLHQQIQLQADENPEKEKELKILEPIEREENSFYNSELGISDIFDNPLFKYLDQDKNSLNKKNIEDNFEKDLVLDIYFGESQNKKQESQILSSFIDEISPELFENKKLRQKKLTKNKRELGRLRKLKAEERKQELLDKLMTSNNTSKAFVKLLEIINIYTEDFISEDLQEIMRRYFPRTEINKILEQKRYLKNLKMRTQIIKMMRINYLNTPISKEKSYFDLFYLNEYDFFIKLYEKSSSNKKSKNKLSSITKIANILIYELSNFVDIVRPFFTAMKSSDLRKTEKIKKNIRYYITEGILSTTKQFADKVYSHGQNITGEELCLTYKVIYFFNEIKATIDALLEDKNLEVAMSVQKQKKMDENKLELLFNLQNGGIENFNRKSLFNFLYKNLNSSLIVANPNYKKNLNDIWVTLNKKMSGIGNYAGYDFLPDYLDLIPSSNMKKINVNKLIVNEYSRLCKFYIQQSKNFKQSALLACFNCVVHESDFNYRETFIKLFMLTYTNEKLRDFEENYMLEILNKSLEYDHIKLHPIILKLLMEEDKKGKEFFLNEINNQLLYNTIVLFVYVNRQEAYNIWENANYQGCTIIKFFQLLARNPSTNLHEFIIKHSHQGKNLSYNFFVIMEALMNKIIKLSKWGKEYDLKNEIFFDNMFILFHNLVICFADHAREADEDSVFLIYSRIKSLIYAFKKILFFETSNPTDMIYELKLSILHIISSLLEEGKARKIIPEISRYFDPFKIFKLCVSNFLVLVKKLAKNPLNELKIEDDSDVKLNLDYTLPQLIKIYQNEDEFSQSPILSVCNKLFSYIRILKDAYKEPNAVKCFYAIKRFKNTKKGPEINNYLKRRTKTDYKFMDETGTLVDTFLEMDEINETEYVVYKFLKHITGVIEVFSYRKKLEYIFFSRTPLTFCLRKNSLKDYLDNFYERGSSFNKVEAISNYFNLALEEAFYNHHLKTSKSMLYSMCSMNFYALKYFLFVINFLSCILSWIWLDVDKGFINTIALILDILSIFMMSGLLLVWCATRFYPKYKHQKYLRLIRNKKSPDSELNIIQEGKVLLLDVLFSDFDFIYFAFFGAIGLFAIIYRLTSLRFFQLTSIVFVSPHLSNILKFIVKNWSQLFMLVFFSFIILATASGFTRDYYSLFPIVKYLF